MKYEKYLVSQNFLDLSMSLKALEPKIINKKLKENNLAQLSDLKNQIINEFKKNIEHAQNDIPSQIYFKNLLNYENTNFLIYLNNEHITSFFVFIYKKNKGYSYYIPTELKEIIHNSLKVISSFAEVNFAISTPSPIIKDLKILLANFTLKELRHLGFFLSLENMSNKSKNQLINLAYDALTSKTKLIDIIKRLTIEEYNFLDTIIANKGTIQQNDLDYNSYYALYTLGIISIFTNDNKIYFTIADEIYLSLTEITLTKYKKYALANTNVYNLVRAMVELYGVVSYTEICYYYSFYYGNKESLEIPDKCLFYCEHKDNITTYNTSEGLYFIHSVLSNDKNSLKLQDIINRQKNIPRPNLSIEEILKYADYEYYEQTPATTQFEQYLKSQHFSPTNIRQIMKLISQKYRLGNTSIEVMASTLQDYGLEITDENTNQILNYLTSIYNNSRIWLNNGWTPKELHQKYQTR